MKQFLDFVPLLLFFATFKALGIYAATAILLISTVLIYAGLYWHSRKLDNTQLSTLVLTLVLGGLTLALHSDTFIKWKAPLVSWIMALTFLGSHFIGRQLLVQRLLGHVFSMPQKLWQRLNLSWAGFMAFLGGCNLFIAFHYPEHWVSFKVFGSMALTILFVGAQLWILRPYLTPTQGQGES